jgi:hypothetical protein
MKTKLWLIHIVLGFTLGFTFMITSEAFAAKLLCVSSAEQKGEQTVSACLAKGEEFAIVDDYGIVHILSPREIALTKAFNPQILGQRAYSLQYQELAPAINPLKRRAVILPNQ